MKRLLSTVIIPLLIGGVIYILFRSDSLVMFSWFESFGVEKIILAFRQLNYGQSNLPNWAIFSLPDALWVFSFTNLMLIIWRDIFSSQSILWIFIAPIIGIVSEVGQGLHFIRGTFDATDLILILIASTLPFITRLKKLKRLQYEIL